MNISYDFKYMSKTFSQHKFSNYTQTTFHKLERYFWATCLVFIVSYGDGNDSLIKISIEQDKRAFCATFCAFLCSSVQIMPTEACNFRSVSTRSFATILGFLVTVLSGICLSFFLRSVYGIWFPVIQLSIYFGISSSLGIVCRRTSCVRQK